MVISFITAMWVLGQEPERMFDPAENYGKTAGQVVAMGYEAWYDLVMEHDGPETTLSMSGANYSYGCALNDVNDDRLKLIPKERQKMILELRPKMLEFRNNCVELGIVMSGGGSLWTIVGSANLMQTEETVAELIKANPKAETKSQAKVWEILGTTEKHLVEMKDEIEAAKQYTRTGYAEADANFKKMRFGWTEALPMISKFQSARDRGRIMHFYYDSVDTITFMEGEPKSR